ncbi:hypothetical protein R3P38DRAFT_2959295 [Favolaschia claudopus]|uniref:DUF6534 domain-containing protein n=1 Tax=Favolaschia claudopus TaxID=2862362 RepID=A0AAW0B8H6_9AGAR
MRPWKLPRSLFYGFLLFTLNDLLGTLCVYANAFITLLDDIDNPQWPAAALLISTGLSALIEQTFMVHRYWMVTRNTIWSLFITLFALAHMSLAIAVVILGGLYNEFATNDPLPLTSIAAILCTVADVLIALSMVWSLSGFDVVSQSTKHLIRSICLNALASGAVVATVTVLAMITLLVESIDLHIFSVFFVIMGRIYSLTIIMNFYQRHRQQALVGGPHEVSMPPSEFIVDSFVPTTVHSGTVEIRTTGRSMDTASPKDGDDEFEPKNDMDLDEISLPRPSRVPALYTTATTATSSRASESTTHSRFAV